MDEGGGGKLVLLLLLQRAARVTNSVVASVSAFEWKPQVNVN